MKISKRIPFRTDRHPKLVNYLESTNLDFCKGDIISSIEILESNPHWLWISDYIQSQNIRVYSETIYSELELQSADRMAIRSKWICGYPQPESRFAYEKTTYSFEHHCAECGTGLFQKDSFRIKKTPNWGKRHFMMLNWVGDELFLDDTAKTILENAGISGIQFSEVKNKSGTQTLANVNQLSVETILHQGIIADRPSIDKVYTCTNCEIKKYHPTGIGMRAFHSYIFDGAPDVVKTAEVFGWGHSAPRLIIVSQKVYQTIIQNQLDKELVFEPLELV